MLAELTTGSGRDDERQSYPELEEMVRQKVASGLYTSAAEVIRETLRLLEEQDRLRAAKLDQLRQDIQDGLKSGSTTAWDAGDFKREGAKRRAARPIGLL